MSVRRTRQPRGDTGATGATPSFSGASVTRAANQTITNNTETVLLFDTERYDTDGYHSTSSLTSRFTVPTAGFYTVGAAVKMNATANGERDLYIRVNGTTTVILDVRNGSAAENFYSSVCKEVQLVANDYVEAVVYQDSGGDLDVERSAQFTPEFWISKR